MRAVVMAGGEGSRLRPLTLSRPKPMLPVVNRPLLGHIFRLLKRHGIEDVVVTLQYMPTQIQDYFGDGKSVGLNIEYMIEDTPLGTAGSVKNAETLLPPDEPFLVISGDSLTNFDLTALLQHHREQGALVTIALYHVANPLEFGVINLDQDGRITQFMEKPGWGEVTSDAVNTGIYIVEPAVLERIPVGHNLDWSHDIFPAMLAQGEPLYGLVTEGYWCDTGTLSEYHRANADLLNGVVQMGELGQHIGGGIWTGGPVEIAPDAQLFGPIYLGPEVKIKGGVVIHGPAVVRDYTVLDNRVRVDRSLIMRNCYVGEGAELHGAVVGRQCSVKARAVIFEGAVIGDRTVIGEGAVIQQGVKIWPNKEVDAQATVNHSIIWGSHGRRVLFGRYGVTGVVNVDLTPDFVARLGAAFGSVLPKGSTVTINRDPHRSPRMLKRALVSGLPSSGNNVLDLRTVPIPVARYYTRAINAAGGVHVRLSPFDQRVVDIRFIDHRGLNLTREQERAVEQAFFREDFRRVYMDDIGNIDYAGDIIEVYVRGYLSAIDVQAVRSARFKMVVDYAHAPTADVLPDILDRLNVEVVPLNARVDPNKISLLQEEFIRERLQLATITGALGDTGLGVRLDIGGEKIFLADDTGTSVSDQVMAAAMAALVLRSYPGTTILVTADQSSVFERLAERFGGYVRRCAVDMQAMMEATAGGGVSMCSDGNGNFIFPALHPAVDGLFALGKLLELLALQHTRLSEVIADLPPFFMAAEQAEGTWDSKGRVMRCLLEQFARYRTETTDGIKVHLDQDEWVLIRPDGDRPIFHVVAEARSTPAAIEIVAKYKRLVVSLVQSLCAAASPSRDTLPLLQ
jgi:mannose-1-phosphate guanylyltransferase / phosphomannomutase